MKLFVKGNCECGSTSLVATRIGTEGNFSGYCPSCGRVCSGGLFIDTQPVLKPNLVVGRADLNASGTMIEWKYERALR